MFPPSVFIEKEDSILRLKASSVSSNIETKNSSPLQRQLVQLRFEKSEEETNTEFTEANAKSLAIKFQQMHDFLDPTTNVATANRNYREGSDSQHKGIVRECIAQIIICKSDDGQPYDLNGIMKPSDDRVLSSHTSLVRIVRKESRNERALSEENHPGACYQYEM